MICRYGMLFQLYALPNLYPHHPQFITKFYGTSCLFAHTQATEAQLILCKGITFSEHLLHAQISYNFGQRHKHKFSRLVPLGDCACILKNEFMKIYARSHKMSFIHHVYILQHLKAIYVYAIRALKNLSKMNKCAISSVYLVLANIKGTFINALVEC